MSTSVFVTGATGFIAQHIVKLLIANGYKVVGTVRSASKGDELKANVNSDNFSYEIVPDMGAKGAFDEALKAHPEVTVFLHTASPFHYNSEDTEKEMLLPALEGTKNALNAIKEYGPQIKKVVVTSSVAAIFSPPKDVTGTVFTEDSWNEITWDEAKANPIVAYLGSKKYAEKAAWDFVKTESPNFTLTTVNPVGVFGPQAYDSAVNQPLGTSSQVITKILDLKEGDEEPKTINATVDVRDVAKAHLVAFEKDEAVGERLFLIEGRRTVQEMLDIINKKFAKNLNGRLPKGKPGSGPEKVKSLGVMDNSKTREILGFELIGVEKTITDAVEQIYKVKGKI